MCNSCCFIKHKQCLAEVCLKQQQQVFFYTLTLERSVGYIYDSRKASCLSMRPTTIALNKPLGLFCRNLAEMLLHEALPKLS